MTPSDSFSLAREPVLDVLGDILKGRLFLNLSLIVLGGCKNTIFDFFFLSAQVRTIITML